MSELTNFNISLTLEEAEALNGSLFKPQTAMVCEKIQKQIIDALNNPQDEDYYVAKYGQPDLFLNNEK